jgi:predicted transcriptional regulator
VDADPSIFETIDLEADEQAMREGEADADAGRVVPHDEVIEWLRTWGSADDRPPPAEWFK